MRNWIMAGSLAAVAALPILAAPMDADAASCRSRKTTGTILGGVGGALLGNAVSHGGGGAVIGGLGGAVVGHEIGRAGCRRYRSASYYRAPARRSSSRAHGYADAAPAPTRTVYYDRYGQPVTPGAGPAGYAPAAYPVASCRMTTRAFYDDRGRLVQQPMQVCDR
ncbi:hypothetical protein [Phenylobacterium sp.]|jgi:hypothetical protein|uniref:hypothetical protein n=1 Tax=Phenylobacterium sp. TaxID=1871053 RepID=UPI002F3FDD67